MSSDGKPMKKTDSHSVLSSFKSRLADASEQIETKLHEFVEKIEERRQVVVEKIDEAVLGEEEEERTSHMLTRRVTESLDEMLQLGGADVSKKLPSAPPPVSTSAEEKNEKDVAFEPVLKKLLKSVLIKRVATNRDIFVLDETATCEEALVLLKEQRILSAPVLSQKKEIIGFCDVTMIVNFLLSKLEDGSDLEEELRTHKIASFVREMAAEPGSWVSIRETDSLYRLLQVFGHGVHRVAITNLTNKLVGVLSQSHIIQLFSADHRLLGPAGPKLVGDLKCFKPRSEMVAVHKSTRTWVAMHLIREHNLSAIPVVDDDDKLVTSFSTNAVKGITSKNLHLLVQPILEFMAQTVPKEFDKLKPEENEEDNKESESNYDNAVGCCVGQKHWTLARVVDALALTRRHRLYLCDDNGKLQGVISMTDIIKQLVFLSPDSK